MAMHYYNNTLKAKVYSFACNGCGAAMAFYSAPASLRYGL